MLGKNSDAIEYASKACNSSDNEKLIEVESCLSSYYSGPSLAYDVNYSKWEALRLYEWSVLYGAIGKESKARSRFYEIIAMRYFDIKRAHILRQDMIREGIFTADMGKYYCMASTPVEDVLCPETKNQKGQ